MPGGETRTAPPQLGPDLERVFRNSSVGKESTSNAGDLSLISGSGRYPGERKGYLLQYSGLENPMDSPWGCKESDVTERLSLFFTVSRSLPGPGFLIGAWVQELLLGWEACTLLSSASWGEAAI